MSTLDDILSGGGAAAKFDNPGDTHVGTITAINVRQARDFDTGKPATWDDGSPQEQIVVTLATDERDPADPNDDGERNVYIKGWGQPLQAFRAAVKQGGKPAVGDRFTATFIGFGPKPDRGFAPKHYQYGVVKASPVDDFLGSPAGGIPQTAGGAQPAAQADPWAQPITTAPAFAQPPTGYAVGGVIPGTAPATVVGGQPAPAAAPVSAPAPQPVSAPAPVAPAPAAPVEDPNAKVRQLISLGLDDATIAGAVGLDPSVVAIFRAQAA